MFQHTIRVEDEKMLSFFGIKEWKRVGPVWITFVFAIQKDFFSLLLRMRTWNRIIWICLKFIQTRVKTVWKLFLVRIKEQCGWIDVKVRLQRDPNSHQDRACLHHRQRKKIENRFRHNLPSEELETVWLTQLRQKKTPINLIKLNWKATFQPWKYWRLKFWLNFFLFIEKPDLAHIGRWGMWGGGNPKTVWNFFLSHFAQS